MNTELGLTNPVSDGFAVHQYKKRVIRGRRVKFTDGRLTVDAQPFSDIELLVADIAQAAQYFPDNGPPESFFINENNPIDRVYELNAAIPEKDWKIGLSGKPEAPWRIYDCVFFVSESTGSTFTMLHNTVGMNLALEILHDQVDTMRKLRGAPVLPIVKIGSALMKTRFGPKARPSFDVVGWKSFSNEHPLLNIVPAPTSHEIVGAGRPWDAARAANL